MDKFLITPKSYNRKLGPIMVTSSARKSCPLVCPFRKTSDGAAAGTCYAEHGFLGGFIWTKLDQLPVGGTFKAGQIKIHSFAELLTAIRGLPDGALWRHNQAGDLASDDRTHINPTKLMAIVSANNGRRGFTYTHYDVEQNQANRDMVRSANAAGFVVNLSANDVSQADRLAELNVGPVTFVLPASVKENHATPAGRKIIICPASRDKSVTCKTCGLCARQRTAIIGFPAIGHAQRR